MAIESVPINSGTGPQIAADQSGTAYYQVVKIAQGADGTFNMADSLAISGTVTAQFVGTQVVNVATITTLLGTVSVSGGGGGAQYPDGTVVNATATGTVIFGVSNNTARTVAIHTTGGLIIASMPAVGGGQQYFAGDTSMGATGTGTLALGIQTGATTGRGLAITTSGQQLVQVSTGTLSVVNILSASGVTIASIATGTVSIVGTPVITATVSVLPAISGSVSVVNTPTVTASQGGTWNIATISTLLGTVAVSGGGGGAQYPVDSTSMGATATGTVILGMQTGATTGRGIAVTTTGGLIIGAMPAVGGGVQYSVGDTAFGATGTGTLIMGKQFGATTARALVLSSTGDLQRINTIGTVVTINSVNVIDNISTGTVSVSNILSASGVTIASVATGTMNVVNILSASGVTIASIATGTMHVINVLSATGVLLAATTANIGSIVGTAHASRWDAYAVNTTSGASVIVKTSGAHTIYVTDLLLSADVPTRIDIYSAATTKLTLYLATKGGFTFPMITPMVLNSNQSLTFQPAVSGSCSLYAAGYTVT